MVCFNIARGDMLGGSEGVKKSVRVDRLIFNFSARGIQDKHWTKTQKTEFPSFGKAAWGFQGRKGEARISERRRFQKTGRFEKNELWWDGSRQR